MNAIKGKKINLYNVIPYLMAFAMTIIIMLFLYYKKGFSPFGENSLATMDANIQYLDFFSYLKDVLSGDNSILYTFGKNLGGTSIGVFSYYLASPFNLLLIFFGKEDVVSFFDIVVALKLGTAAITATYFLKQRFKGTLNNCFAVLLAVSYALMQFSIAQSSNIMWLDGVYMLPLMLLGVYRIVNGKRANLLIFSTGLSIIFSWYSAGINCLYTIIWFCLEWMLNIPEKFKFSKEFVKSTLKKVGCYIISMLSGVLLSACLFLPTIISLMSGGEGNVDGTFENVFEGNAINIIQNLVLGSKSSKGEVSLYCGSLAILGCIGFFFSKNKSFTKKLKIGAVLVISILIYYWQPLITLFSLLKDVRSYWYRYSYITIFLIIFIAADYFSEIVLERESKKHLIKIAIYYIIALMAIAYINSESELKKVYYTCIFVAVIAFITVLFVYTLNRNVRCKIIATVMLAGVMFVELAYNTNLLMESYHKENGTSYHDYSVNQQNIISKLQEEDTDFYRISQTYTYNTSSSTGLTANFNESLAYNYWSIAGYTSDPDGMQNAFLDKVGYHVCRDDICYVGTSILAADSLLGVKYVLSPYEINGLELVDSQETYNTKYIYYNPYFLPMAFSYSNTDLLRQTTDNLNSFEYQNLLYSQLLGKEVELYVPLNFEVEENEEECTRIYTIELSNGNYAVYGNIIGSDNMNGSISVNDAYDITYAVWNSPTVFYIPTQSDDSSATVTFTYAKNNIIDEQFYLLDLDLLETVTKEISSREAEEIYISNGYAKFEVEGNEGENLYISIPYNDGWTVTLNGQEIEPDMFADCMFSVELEDGSNIIEMEYHVPYLKTGIIISVVTLILILQFAFFKNKKSLTTVI